MRIILLGCTKTKAVLGAGDTLPAAELYTSTLWQKRRRYAEQAGHTWRVLSAEHGVIDPAEQIGTYDTTIATISRAWIKCVGGQVARLVRASGARRLLLEVHAGAPYVQALRNAVELRGELHGRVKILQAGQGKQIGELLRWYNLHAAEYEAAGELEQADGLADTVAAALELYDLRRERSGTSWFNHGLARASFMSTLARALVAAELHEILCLAELHEIPALTRPRADVQADIFNTIMDKLGAKRAELHTFTPPTVA